VADDKTKELEALAEELAKDVRSGKLSQKDAASKFKAEVKSKGLENSSANQYLGEPIVVAGQAFDKQMKKAAQTAAAGGPLDPILNNDAGKAEIKKISTKAAEAAGSSDPATAGQSALDRLTATLTGGSTSPDWFAGTLGVPEVTADQKQEIIKTWNQENPEDPISSDADFNSKLGTPSPYVRRMVQDAVWGTRPDQAWSIRVGPGDAGVLKVADSQMKAVQKLYGYDEHTLTALLRDGMDLGITKVAGAPSVYDQMSAATGQGSITPKIGNVSWAPLMAIARKTGMSNSDVKTSVYDAMSEVTGQGTARAKFSPEYYAASQRYKQGLDKYGDPLMAYLATFDESLASRLVVADGTISDRDATAMGQLLLDGFGQASGGDAQGAADVLMQLGQFTSNGALKKALGKQQKAAAEPKGPVVQLPDPEKIRQATQEVWQSLMLGDPDEATMNSIIGAINSNVSSNTASAYEGGVTVTDMDPMAKIKMEAKNTSIYHELFGNKPQGMSDEEYVQMQKQGVGSMLGNETDPNLVRAGMRSGNYQGAVGSALGSSQAWQNSTFMDRLARAGVAANEVT
jgi:hypothetical protein